MKGYLLVAIVFIVIPIFSLNLRRFPYVVLLGVALAIVWPPVNDNAIIGFGHSNLYFSDIVTLISLAGLVATQWRQLHTNLRGLVVPFLFLALTASELVVGYRTYGQSALNEARSLLWLLIPTIYFLTLDRLIWAPKILRAYVLLSWALTCIALVHLRLHGLGSAISSIYNPITGQLTSGRVLNAQQSLIVGIGAVICVYDLARSRGRLPLFGAGAFLTIVLLAQNRSAWLATAIGLTFLGVTHWRSVGRAVLRIASVLVVVGAVLLATGGLRTVIGRLAQSTGELSIQHSTLAWREQGWALLVQSSFHLGARAILLGQPFGSGYDRYINGGLIVASPHNWYVMLYLKCGLIGLFLVVVILARAWHGGDGTANAYNRALLLTLVAFGLAYSIDASTGPLLAVVIAGVPRTFTPSEEQKLHDISNDNVLRA